MLNKGRSAFNSWSNPVIPIPVASGTGCCSGGGGRWSWAGVDDTITVSSLTAGARLSAPPEVLSGSVSESSDWPLLAVPRSVAAAQAATGWSELVDGEDGGSILARTGGWMPRIYIVVSKIAITG